MKLSRQTKKKVIIGATTGIVILVVAVVLGLMYNVSFVGGIVDLATYPLKKGINFVETELSEFTTYFKNVDELIEQQELLQEENDRLLYENTILEQYKDENDQLKGLLDISQRYKDYPQMGANIVAKEAGNWYKSFTIDKGVDASIKEHDVVLASGGLVGHVSESNLLTSQVISIIDDRSSISAKIVRTGDTGILKGDIELSNLGIAKLELHIEAEVVKGDQIVTSHLSSYPPGIPIGVVEEVITGENGLTQYAYVKPFVDFNHLQSVLIIQND